jgi:hypothetical protein
VFSSRLASRFILLLSCAGVISHAGFALAGTNSVDLSTSIGQIVSGPVEAGTEFQLHWEIANKANSTSSEALGRLLFDARSQFIEASCPSAFEAGVLTWSPPTVALNAPRQCMVTLRSDDQSTVLFFTATVETSQSDSDTDENNNIALLQVVVERGTNNVDLAVSLDEMVAGPVSTGAGFDLLWVVANLREGNVSSAAESRLQLAPQVELVGTSCPSQFDAGIVTWTPPSIDNAAPRQCVVNLRSTGNDPIVLTFETQVATSTQDTDTDSTNNSATLQVTVARGAPAARELPIGGWPGGIALVAGLIACARAARGRFAIAQRGSWAGGRRSQES